MGTFVADPTLPVAVVDCTGRNLVIIPAYASSRHDWLESANNSLAGTTNNNSPQDMTMHVVDESDTDGLVVPAVPDLSPMRGSGTNLMITTLGNNVMSSGGHVTGPPELFYTTRSFGDSSYDEEDDDEDDDDDDDDEAMLNVNDFIDFGNGSSDDEAEKVSEDEEDLISSPLVAPSVQRGIASTPSRVIEPGQESNAEQFLKHLDQGIVTAFRRNHNRYQALIRLPPHREFMPANSPSKPASVFRRSRYSDTRSSIRKRKAPQYPGSEAVRRKLIATQRPVEFPF
jgi:hypothetical protein